MENTIDRSKEWNSRLYRLFGEKELDELTDEEFEVLVAKVETPLRYTLPPLDPSFASFFAGDNLDAFDWDKTEMAIYKRKMAADFCFFGGFDQYARIFSLCRTIGAKNIYDIGCGSNLQAFLMVYSQDMSYTGIDDRLCAPIEFGWPFDKKFEPSPEYLNDLFKKFVGSDRIRFVKDTYPCKLDIAENNIAVSLGSITSHIINKPETMISIARDFERIMIDIPDKKMDVEGFSAKDIIYNDVNIWRNTRDEYVSRMQELMPEFTFYDFGGHLNHTFGTRVPSDKERLDSKFVCVNGRYMTGLFDMEWYREMDR